MIRKPFSQQLHKENDEKAKNLVQKYIERIMSFQAFKNDDPYGYDLLLLQEGSLKAYAECEIKHSWKVAHFPFKTVQFPERRQQALNKTALPIYFFMLNSTCTQGLWVSRADLSSSPLVEVSNKYVKSGEKFFQVPIQKVHFFSL